MSAVHDLVFGFPKIKKEVTFKGGMKVENKYENKLHRVLETFMFVNIGCRLYQFNS